MRKREDTKIKKMKAEKKKAKVLTKIQHKMIDQHFPLHHLFLTATCSLFNLWVQLEQADKDLELKADSSDPTAPLPAPGSAAAPKKPGRRRSAKVEAPPRVQQTDEERIAQGKRVLGARSKAKALAKAQAEAEAAAQKAQAVKRAAERRVQVQRRLEERKRQQIIADELKKPTEDMCLTDHKVSFEFTLFYFISNVIEKNVLMNFVSISRCQSCPVSRVWFFLEKLLHTAWLWLSSYMAMGS